MYERVKSFLLWLARVPPEPLDPMGDAQSLRVFRAAPGYLRYITAGWLLSQISLLIGVLIGLAIVLDTTTARPAAMFVTGLASLAVLFFLIQAIVTYFWMRLNYELRWYKVTDRSLRIRSGVVNVHELTMTFANVQNITITQGPLERLFGISDVRVQTAGGGGHASPHGTGEGLGGNLHVGVFRGVENPEEIRDLMAERLRRLRDTGLGDPDETRGWDAAPALGSGFGAGREMSNGLVAFRDEARALRRAAQAALPAYRRNSNV